MDTAREGGLPAWQWRLYPEGHRDRANLLIHVVTVPLFQAGLVCVLSAPFTRWWMAAAGLGAMVTALALQGRGHKREGKSPEPFAGPLDAPARLVLEQCFTFPRYVLSGGFARAWRESGARSTS